MRGVGRVALFVAAAAVFVLGDPGRGAGTAAAQSGPQSVTDLAEWKRIRREVFVELSVERARIQMAYNTWESVQGRQLNENELYRIKMLAEQIANEAFRPAVEVAP